MRKKRLLAVLFSLCFLFTAASSVSADSYDLKEVTPAIKQALSNRQARYDQLQKLKAENIVGEDSHGYVNTLRSSPDVDAIVSAENADRWVIYKGIAEQNSLGPEGRGVVEAVFAEVQREKARSGDQVQDPSGEWKKK